MVGVVVAFLKSNRHLRIVLSLVCLFIFDVQAMVQSSILSEEDKLLNVSLKTICKYKKLNLLKTKEETKNYDKLWVSERTLFENQENIRKEFIRTCCDFSIKNIKSSMDGVYLGNFEDGENIIFTDKNICMGVKSDLSKVLLINSKNMKIGLKVDLETLMMPGTKPLGFKVWMKDKFREYIHKLSEDSVGCEILRIAVAKYKGSKNRLPKIKIVPIDSDEIGLSYTVGTTVWKCLSEENKRKFGKTKKYVREDKIILFSPKILRKELLGVFIDIKEKIDEGEINVNTNTYPMESGFLRHLLYALHDDAIVKFRETKIIRSRANQNYFYGYIPKLGVISTPGEKMNVSIFRNDEVFRAMFGITAEGIDLLNESAYLAHRYNCLMPIPEWLNIKLKIAEKTKDISSFYKLLCCFLEFNADYGLYLYYLSTESSIKFPEFGKGAYKYRAEGYEIKK